MATAQAAVEGIREIETLPSRVFWLVAVFNIEVTRRCNPRNWQIAQRKAHPTSITARRASIPAEPGSRLAA
jgi:hypothetical protein